MIDLVRAVAAGELQNFDPRDAGQEKEMLRLADRLIDTASRTEELADLERALTRGDDDIPLAAHVALKLARSKAIVRSLEEPLHVSIVFAVYREHARMLRPDEDPLGEDFLIRKIEQLRWLFENSAVTWDMFIVDDGCPDGSDRLARDILDERCPDAPVRVLFLADAIEQGLPITRPMKSVTESQKGGSIVYGMWTAAQQDHDNHILLFTDADLSTHLGQTGLLIEGVVRGGKDAAIGSRREPTSVVVKTGLRNTRGKLFIYLWKGLIRPLHYITDTQCGFKAFTAQTVREVFVDLVEKRFAFDIELLLKTELRSSDSITRIPIAWIDSEAASTTTGIRPYLSMLRAVAAMYREYLPADPEGDALAHMLESVSEADWAYLAKHVPAEIADADPAVFSRIRPVGPEDLRGVIRDRGGEETE